MSLIIKKEKKVAVFFTKVGIFFQRVFQGIDPDEQIKAYLAGGEGRKQLHEQLDTVLGAVGGELGGREGAKLGERGGEWLNTNKPDIVGNRLASYESAYGYKGLKDLDVFKTLSKGMVNRFDTYIEAGNSQFNPHIESGNNKVNVAVQMQANIAGAYMNFITSDVVQNEIGPAANQYVYELTSSKGTEGNKFLNLFTIGKDNPDAPEITRDVLLDVVKAGLQAFRVHSERGGMNYNAATLAIGTLDNIQNDIANGGELKNITVEKIVADYVPTALIQSMEDGKIENNILMKTVAYSVKEVDAREGGLSQFIDDISNSGVSRDEILEIGYRSFALASNNKKAIETLETAWIATLSSPQNLLNNLPDSDIIEQAGDIFLKELTENHDAGDTGIDKAAAKALDFLNSKVQVVLGDTLNSLDGTTSNLYDAMGNLGEGLRNEDPRAGRVFDLFSGAVKESFAEARDITEAILVNEATGFTEVAGALFARKLSEELIQNKMFHLANDSVQGDVVAVVGELEPGKSGEDYASNLQRLRLQRLEGGAIEQGKDGNTIVTSGDQLSFNDYLSERKESLGISAKKAVDEIVGPAASSGLELVAYTSGWNEDTGSVTTKKIAGLGLKFLSAIYADQFYKQGNYSRDLNKIEDLRLTQTLLSSFGDTMWSLNEGGLGKVVGMLSSSKTALKQAEMVDVQILNPSLKYTFDRVLDAASNTNKNADGSSTRLAPETGSFVGILNFRKILKENAPALRGASEVAFSNLQEGTGTLAEWATVTTLADLAHNDHEVTLNRLIESGSKVMRAGLREGVILGGEDQKVANFLAESLVASLQKYGNRRTNKETGKDRTGGVIGKDGVTPELLEKGIKLARKGLSPENNGEIRESLIDPESRGLVSELLLGAAATITLGETRLSAEEALPSEGAFYTSGAFHINAIASSLSSWQASTGDVALRNDMTGDLAVALLNETVFAEYLGPEGKGNAGLSKNLVNKFATALVKGTNSDSMMEATLKIAGDPGAKKFFASFVKGYGLEFIKDNDFLDKHLRHENSVIEGPETALRRQHNIATLEKYTEAYGEEEGAKKLEVAVRNGDEHWYAGVPMKADDVYFEGELTNAVEGMMRDVLTFNLAEIAYNNDGKIAKFAQNNPALLGATQGVGTWLGNTAIGIGDIVVENWLFAEQLTLMGAHFAIGNRDVAAYHADKGFKRSYDFHSDLVVGLYKGVIDERNDKIDEAVRAEGSKLGMSLLEQVAHAQNGGIQGIEVNGSLTEEKILESFRQMVGMGDLVAVADMSPGEYDKASSNPDYATERAQRYGLPEDMDLNNITYADLSPAQKEGALRNLVNRGTRLFTPIEKSLCPKAMNASTCDTYSTWATNSEVATSIASFALPKIPTGSARSLRITGLIDDKIMQGRVSYYSGEIALLADQSDEIVLPANQSEKDAPIKQEISSVYLPFGEGKKLSEFSLEEAMTGKKEEVHVLDTALQGVKVGIVDRGLDWLDGLTSETATNFNKGVIRRSEELGIGLARRVEFAENGDIPGIEMAEGYKERVVETAIAIAETKNLRELEARSKGLSYDKEAVERHDPAYSTKLAAQNGFSNKSLDDITYADLSPAQKEGALQLMADDGDILFRRADSDQPAPVRDNPHPSDGDVFSPFSVWGDIANPDLAEGDDKNIASLLSPSRVRDNPHPADGGDKNIASLLSPSPLPLPSRVRDNPHPPSPLEFSIDEATTTGNKANPLSVLNPERENAKTMAFEFHNLANISLAKKGLFVEASAVDDVLADLNKLAPDLNFTRGEEYKLGKDTKMVGLDIDIPATADMSKAAQVLAVLDSDRHGQPVLILESGGTDNFAMHLGDKDGSSVVGWNPDEAHFGFFQSPDGTDINYEESTPGAVLMHELIHVFHKTTDTTGTGASLHGFDIKTDAIKLSAMNATPNEELSTMGIVPQIGQSGVNYFETNCKGGGLSENCMRAEAGLPLRMLYIGLGNDPQLVGRVNDALDNAESIRFSSEPMDINGGGSKTENASNNIFPELNGHEHHAHCGHVTPLIESKSGSEFDFADQIMNTDREGFMDNIGLMELPKPSSSNSFSVDNAVTNAEIKIVLDPQNKLGDDVGIGTMFENTCPGCTFQDTLLKISENASSRPEFNQDTRAIIEQQAKEIELAPEILHAFTDVEASGRFFSKETKLPLIRVELHRFEKYLNDENKQEFDKYFSADGWKKHGFDPTGQGNHEKMHTRSQQREWDALNIMTQIDRDAALKATSFGAGQVMGFNHKVIGYENPTQMFVGMTLGKDIQLEAMKDFIGNNSRLHKALQIQDFERAAALYNGPGQKEAYGKKLEKAHTEFRKIYNEPLVIPKPPVYKW